MQDEKIVAFDLGAYATREELLAQISAELHFPAHFGKNLSALADCLGDVSTPTTIIALRPEGALPTWAAKTLRVIERVAGENPSLDFRQY